MIRQGTHLFRILSTPSMMTTGRRLSCTSRRGWSATARPRKPTAWARRMWPPFMPSRWGGNLMTVCLPVQVVWSTDTYPKFWLTSCLGRNVEIIKWADRKESCFASSCHCLCTCSFMSCSRSPVTSVSLLSSSPLFCFFFFFFFFIFYFETESHKIIQPGHKLWFLCLRFPSSWEDGHLPLGWGIIACSLFL